MNYLAHALPFLDEPYVAAGSGVPDMLVVVDRGIRIRTKHVRPFLADRDPLAAAGGRGIAQHLRDDARFHESAAFVRLSGELSVRFAEVLDEPSGMRPRFLGHLLVELLLDAALAAESPGRLARYYEALAAVDPERLERAVNRMASRPTGRLAAMIRGILAERFLPDYLEDATLMVRLNQIMRRVGFAPLPPGFQAALPEARRRVQAERDALLHGIPVIAVPHEPARRHVS